MDENDDYDERQKLYFHISANGRGPGHMTADEMDEKRKQNVAYEYLCHLEEAKV